MVVLGLCVVTVTVVVSLALKYRLGISLTVIFGLTAAATVAYLSVTWATYGSRRTGMPQPTRIADELVQAVQAQWQTEVYVRGLADPYPLPVGWVAADVSAVDSWDGLEQLATTGAGWPLPSVTSWAHGPNELRGQGNQLLHVLEKVPTRRLVVLGAPGSGKTMLIVRLALDLIASRAPGDPVPVIADLSSWDPGNYDLHSWLSRRLTMDYPALAESTQLGRGKQTRVEALLSAGLILPILDGLDEIPDTLRSLALARINDSLRPGEAVVVTSRTAEFRRAVQSPGGARGTLRAAAGIELRPLDLQAVSQYLQDATTGEASRRWNNVLGDLSPEEPLAHVLSNPQMLSWASAIYSPIGGERSGSLPNPRELKKLADEKAIERHLVEAFIPSVYRPSPQRWSVQDAEHWLAFMARQLQRLGTTDLAWWQIPASLRRQRVTLAVIGGSLCGTALLIAWLAAKVVHNLPTWPLYRILGWFAFVITLTAVPTIMAVLTLLLRRPALPESQKIQVTVTYLDRVNRLLFPQQFRWPADVAAAPNPTTALRSARASAIFQASVYGLIVVPVLVSIRSFFGDILPISMVVIGALYIALLLVMTTAWGNFKLAHAWCAVRGELPYSLFAFLEDAQRRGLLRIAGAVYQFRHARLQEVLADPAHTPGFRRKIEDLTQWALENPEISDAYANVNAKPSDIEQAVSSLATESIRTGRGFEANVAFRQAALERIRLRLNELGRRSLFSKNLRAQRAPGLGAVLDPAHIVLTDAMNEVEGVADSVSSASVGISGVRGVGKSTLIRWICESKDPSRGIPKLGLYVTAPVKYDARDFLIHLYTRLCEVVLLDDRLASKKVTWKNWIRRHALGMTAVLLGIGSLIVFFHLSFNHWLHILWVDSHINLWQAIGITGLTIAIIFACAYWQRLRHGKNGGTVADSARHRLRRLQYQLTETTGGQAGTITGPYGLTLAGSYSRAVTEYQMTLPELVDEYKAFAAQVISSLQDLAQVGGATAVAQVRLIVGIDEIDRIENAENAEKFINEIKSIFGVPHCFHIASLSADALAQFERRAVTARTAFESAFDKMVRLDPLDLKTAMQLLGRRVIGLPYPFVALCHVLSGGVPRELMRVARDVFEVRTNTNNSAQHEVSCDVVADEIISRELYSTRQGLLPIAAQLAVPGISDFVGILDDRGWPTGDISGDIARMSKVLSNITSAAKMDGTLTAAENVCDRFAAAVFFFLTVGEIFRQRIEDVVTELVAYDSAKAAKEGPLQTLVKARAVLAVNPSLAVNRVRDFRAEYRLPNIKIDFLSQA